MNKLTKLIEDAEKAEQGDWHFISDPLFDSERWNGQVVISRDGRIVSRICECEEDSGVHIANMQPWNILPILRAFQKMQNLLEEISKTIDTSQLAPASNLAIYMDCVGLLKDAQEAIDNL